MTPDSVKWFDVWIEFQLFRFAGGATII